MEEGRGRYLSAGDSWGEAEGVTSSAGRLMAAANNPAGDPSAKFINVYKLWKYAELRTDFWLRVYLMAFAA